MRNELPETCFATLPGQGDLIILKRGETGYYPSDLETGDKIMNQEIADSCNRAHGITSAQIKAMRAGSMFGFDVPGANPQVYFDEARYVRSPPLDEFAVIEDPVTSCCSSIEGKLYLYQVAEKRSLYMDVASMPESLMGKRNDLIILPDMVCGKPLVPVDTLRFDEVSGTRVMGLESGAYSQGKEMNANYQIIAKVCVGPVEYALGELDGKFPSFVTWERTPANDGDGPPNYYWGHYFDSKDKAVQDFCERAGEKFKMLAQYRKHHKPSIKARLVTQPIYVDKTAAKSKDREAR